MGDMHVFNEADTVSARAASPASAEKSGSARLIENVEVVLEACVGAARLTVRELTALKPGETVTLDAALNQAVELRLNGVAVARGELVAVGDRFGVRLTEIAE